MAEWLYEAGIGEDRAALVEHGAIVEIRIERHDTRARLGAIMAAKLTRKAGPAGHSAVTLDCGDGALLSAVPTGLTEGASLLVEIVREAIPERGNPKLPLARPSDAATRPAPTLIESLSTSGIPVRPMHAHEPDLLEAAGWSEAVEQAQAGIVPFPGGLLRIDLTAAMTVIDVDGELPPADLAIRGATAAARAIRRFGIGGSIAIDLPTLPSKAARQAAAEAIDAALPPPFERTAVNGFGLLQIVRRRVRPSLLELVQGDPVRAEALALLRRLEREKHTAMHTAPAAVALHLRGRPDWMELLARRRGSSVSIVAQ